MLKRIITAVIAIPLIILLVKSSNDYIYFAAILAVIVLALKELFEIILAGEPVFGKWLAILMGCLVPIFVFLELLLLRKTVCIYLLHLTAYLFLLYCLFFYHIVWTAKEDNAFAVISTKFFWNILCPGTDVLYAFVKGASPGRKYNTVFAVYNLGR